MILSFADRRTEELFRTEKSRHYSSILRPALRKLIQMNHSVVFKGFTQFVLMISGELCSDGLPTAQATLRLQITIDRHP